jgi:TolB-like protein
MNLTRIIAELKRRNVYKVAVAYAVVAWLLAQIATQIFPFFEIPNWGVRLIVLLLVIGFPIALVLSWAFDITKEGIKRADNVLPNDSTTNRSARKIVGVVLALALIAASLLAFKLRRSKSATSPVAEINRATIAEKSIAVLPFENRSEDKANAYFADGIQDEILSRLSKIADLKVISRTSTQHYRSAPQNLPEIARQLGVAHILEGSVQKSGDAVRVNVQLIKAANDSHLWADTFDRKLTDIFSVESEVARAIGTSYE